MGKNGVKAKNQLIDFIGLSKSGSVRRRYGVII
jgi:hypothetical protein